MMFLPSLSQASPWKSSNRFYCACSNCVGKSYCWAEIACYRASRSSFCKNTNDCFGCFNDRFQSLQVSFAPTACRLGLLNSGSRWFYKCGTNRPNIAVACCNDAKLCNQNLTIPEPPAEDFGPTGKFFGVLLQFYRLKLQYWWRVVGFRRCWQ